MGAARVRVLSHAMYFACQHCKTYLGSRCET